MVGVTRPNLDPHSPHYYRESCTDTWFMDVFDGGRNGNGFCDDAGDGAAGAFEQGDCAGVEVDFFRGSIRFFKNGIQHGPGYPAGSVTGPVVHAVLLSALANDQESARLLPHARSPPAAQGAASRFA